MRCPNCQSENREGRRYCGACGTALPAPCPACGFTNDPGERFCGGCGAPLSSAAPQSQPRADPLQPELRPATVLFADIVGFTSLANRVDPEALQTWLDRFFELADAQVLHFGGSVDKHIGDGLMAVFGAPVAHDNDPQRASRCAEALHQMSLLTPEPGGKPALLHIGIAAGTVMASPSGSSLHRSYTVTGPSVNLAARLCELAGPGQTLVSESVAHAVSNHFEIEPLGAIAVAGFEAPVSTWQLHYGRPDSRPQSSLPLIGRVREVRQISGILDACLEAGSGQVVVLRGEAGIGKSRLVDKIEELARERGFRPAKASLFDFGGGRERDPTRTLAAALLDLPANADEALRRERLERAAAEGLVTGTAHAALADLLDLPLQEEARSIYDAMPAQARIQATDDLLGVLLHAAVTITPRLLAIEDVHWADTATLSRIAALGARAGGVPCIIVLTTRIAGDPLNAAWRARLRSTPISTVDLAPLSHTESMALAGALLGRVGSDFSTLVDRAEGNPLFLVQLVRHADESLSTAVPDSIQSLVLSRADKLAPEDKRLLQTAAILGQRFTLEVLRYLAEQPLASLETLVAHGLMLPAGEECSFAHALVHDAIYASLPKARREALHRRAAEWYLERDPGLYAQHLDRANDLQAAEAFLHAASLARSSYRLEEALSLVEQGEKAAGVDAVRIALALERGSLLHDLGRTEDTTAAYQSALDLAKAPKDRCLALIGLAASMRISDRIEEALQALSEAEEIASTHALNAERARIHYLRGSLYFPRGWMHESRIEQEQALQFARSAGSPELELLALSGLGDAYYGEGRMRSASQAFAHCIALAREHGFGRIEVANLPMLAFTEFLNGELRAALDIGREAVAAARRVGNRRGEIIGHHVVFATNLERDDLETAQRALNHSHELAVELKARRFQAEGLGFMAQIARCRGDRVTAVSKAREALAIARETGIEYVGGLILGELAAAAESESERQQAREEALTLLARGSLPHNHFWFYQTSIEADLARGAWDDVLRWADALEAYTMDERHPFTELLIRLARLSVRAAQSGNQAAAAELETVASALDKRGYARLAKLSRKMAIPLSLTGGD
jgi:class 3 adenylate cyclase/tetratricopeptide (TPR) repeat protein